MIARYSFAAMFSAFPTSEGYGNLYGMLALLAFAPVFATAIEPVRRALFEAFYFTHQFVFVGVLFSFLHSRTAFYLGTEFGMPRTCRKIVETMLNEACSRQPSSRHAKHGLEPAHSRKSESYFPSIQLLRDLH